MDARNKAIKRIACKGKKEKKATGEDGVSSIDDSSEDDDDEDDDEVDEITEKDIKRGKASVIRKEVDIDTSLITKEQEMENAQESIRMKKESGDIGEALGKIFNILFFFHLFYQQEYFPFPAYSQLDNCHIIK